jgi:ppGpp synthetase/RelA/SpoT-type nucleotidyltranferase
MTPSPTFEASAIQIAAKTAQDLQLVLGALPLEAAGPLVVWRIKSAESVRNKLGRRHLRGRDSQFVNDYIGIRVIVGHPGQITPALHIVTAWLQSDDRFRILSLEDYFESPHPGDYRSVHLDLALVPNRVDGPLDRDAGVEIQITTYLQHYYSAVSHKLAYANGRFAPPDDGAAHLLASVAAQLRLVDGLVASLFERKPSPADDV